MATQNPMNNNLNFRISSLDKKMIESAANFKGIKPNTYARQKLLEAAERDLAEMSKLNSVVLEKKAWDRLMEMMDAPIEINENLKKAADDFKRMFGNET